MRGYSCRAGKDGVSSACPVPCVHLPAGLDRGRSCRTLGGATVRCSARWDGLETRYGRRGSRWLECDRELSERYLARTLAHPLFWARRSLWKAVQTASNGRTGIVLDVGCGMLPYKRLFDRAHFVGVDIDSESLADIRGDLAS